MASLEQRNGWYRIIFRFGGEKFHGSLKTKDVGEAETITDNVEKRLKLLEEGLISVPEEADFVTWIISDGRQAGKPRAKKSPTLKQVFSEYEESLPAGAIESNSLKTTRTHMKHFGDILGDIKFHQISSAVLQQYINQRRTRKTRKGTVTGTTIRKEISTLSSIWTFALSQGYVNGAFPNQGLKYPKASEKPPFQTREEIQRQIAQGADEELWESLFLSTSEIRELLACLQQNARHEMIYPMVATAAYTGARRSELLRSQLSDLAEETITIREKKRSRAKYTTRKVPIPDPLKPILSEWICRHPGGKLTFPFTVDQSNHYLRASLSGAWAIVRGWHIFRHSFISNCAAAGVDQRMIDAWSGHQTDEMRRRYTHLFPDQQRSAINSVFE